MSFRNFLNTGGLGPVGDIFGGLFGGQDAGYNEAAKRMERYMREATGAWEPFFNAGKGAIDPFQRWGEQYKNPEEFLKNTFSKYSMSPQAQYQMGQAERAAKNAASASGLSGSTAHMRESANMANDIASKDMQQYLQNIMGIGGQYGNSLKSLLDMGLAGAKGKSGVLENMGGGLAGLFGEGARARQDQFNQLIGGGLNLLPFLF